MKFIIINRKRFSSYLFILVIGMGLVALFITVGRSGVLNSIDVFSNQRVLPIYSVETDRNLVSVTFDCAWGAGDIPTILEILKKENVRASFFMVGQWGEKYPDAVKLIANDGHDVANHGYSHLRMSTIGKEKCRSEIELCNQKLGEISGTKVILFRPPYGDYNNTVIETCNELGSYPIQWNVDSLDWKKEMSRQAILERILKRTKPGSIILFHNDTQYTVELLPQIISQLKAKGLDFVPVSELIMKDNYYIDDQGRQQRK
ncbi:polysaccharide deacetylase family protein [Ruminiclostridium cellobioparum]|jgi:polysaccharide deacetylase family sporulation protein PdaB|uniref:polysaccharide deacetylase family protein n=1 Tax=Ruminiclostridium cellobioparum TaxID=29355 RepID=UPI000485F9C4|nr:polysaccharide deacetylase family protein [Ruminiclostridium cellobioparum]